MARCLGPNSPYGCGHHTEHVAAAKKGWITRRAKTKFFNSGEHGALKALFGKDVTLAHEHPSHAGFAVFKSGDKWYEVPSQIFRQEIRHGKLLQGQQAKDVIRQRREDERIERSYQREVAKVEKEIERHKAQEEKKKLAQRHKEELDRLKERRYRQREEQRVSASGYAQYKEVVHAIRRQGGIRPDKVSSASSKGEGPGKQYRGLGEWQALPRSVRTYKGIQGRKPQPLDDVAQSIAEEFPDLPIGRGDDLALYLQMQGRMRGGMFPRRVA